MKSALNHLQINIDPKNKDFYKELFMFLSWVNLYDEDSMVAFTDSAGQTSLWFMEGIKPEEGDYDKHGVNHIGIKVDNQGDVDQTASFLKDKGIEMLFNTPRHRPEFSAGAGETYYQIMFESPDKVLFEIVYTGKKE